MFACDCLNILIETDMNVSNDLPNVTKDLKDPFFEQESRQIGKLINITKVHPGLIETRNVGSWDVHQCLNCNLHTHATHREKGALCVLVNSALVPSETIARLRSSPKFSEVFGILIETDKYDDEEIPLELPLPRDLEATVKSFKQIASDVLKKVNSEVEQRIKQFTEDQYSVLDNLRVTAFSEQQALIRIILAHNTNKTKSPQSTNKNMVSELASSELSHLKDPVIPVDDLTNSLRHTSKRQKGSQTVPASSFDSEGLFEFDCTDDINSEEETNVESDQEDEITIKSERSAQFKKRSSSISVAKSLPMNIPVFLQQMKNHENEDGEEDLLAEDNIDIAANIQKLAKSVHGNTVFGDLPKPRFSTQL